MINIHNRIYAKLPNSVGILSGPGDLTMLVIIVLGHMKLYSFVNEVIMIVTMVVSSSTGIHSP